MARLSDVPRVLSTVGFVGFAKRVWGQVTDDDLFTWAAALAYSWLFAVFPFMIFLLTLLPYLPSQAKVKAKTEIQDMVYRTIPSTEAADTVWNNIDNNLSNLLHDETVRLIPRLIGLGLAIWAASGGMAMTMAALDKCYEIEKGRPLYIQRALAMALTIVVAILLILVVSLLPIGTLVKTWVEQKYLPPGHPLLIIFDVVRWTLALIFMVAVVAIVYYKGPCIQHRFVLLSPGGAFSILVWITLGFVFRLYVVKYGHYNRTYGAVGGVAVLLLFFYIDALVLLIGAEIDSEVDFEVLKVRRGTRDFRLAQDLVGEPAPTSL